jgi:DNA-binding PadR family transcriptional regulator
MSEGVARKREAATMRSPLAWALLGLIIERPSHGYELAQRFKHIYGDTVVLDSRLHIYRLLETLSNHMLIEVRREDVQEPAPGRRPDPDYHATATGVRAYEEWLITQFDEQRRRSQLFARQLAMLEPEAALDVIDRHERECLSDAAKLAASETEEAEGVAERLANEGERLALGVRLSWLDYARHELKALLGERTHRR